MAINLKGSGGGLNVRGSGNGFMLIKTGAPGPIVPPGETHSVEGSLLLRWGDVGGGYGGVTYQWSGMTIEGAVAAAYGSVGDFAFSFVDSLEVSPGVFLPRAVFTAPVTYSTAENPLRVDGTWTLDTALGGVVCWWFGGLQEGGFDWLLWDGTSSDPPYSSGTANTGRDPFSGTPGTHSLWGSRGIGTGGGPDVVAARFVATGVGLIEMRVPVAAV